MIRLLRPHQWTKNLLLFVPLAVGHRLLDRQRVVDAIVAFIAFSLVASAGYILNDLRDREADRHHPRKKDRPIAAGEVAPVAAWTLSALLLIGAIALALLLPREFAVWLAVYFVGTAAYSLWLKSRMLVDVLALAGLYTIRILAGGAASAIELSPWLLAFSMFFFLSLAFVKRYVELSHANNDEPLKSRNYSREDMAMVLAVGPASGYMAVLIQAIYINSDFARSQYHQPRLLWLVCPVLLYWITRIWFVAHRKAMPDDPIVFALTDRVSWASGALTALLIVLAATL